MAVSDPLFKPFKPSEGGAIADFRNLRAANQETVVAGSSDQWLRKFDITLYDAGLASDSATIGSVAPSGSSTESLEKEEEAREITGGGQMNLTPDGHMPQFQVKFQIRKTTNQAPNLLSCKIYNVSRNTMSKIQLFRRVVVKAGYRTGRYGIVFNGTVMRYVRGRDNATDSYLEIIAGDGDVAAKTDVYRAAHKEGEEIREIIKTLVNGMTGITEAIINTPEFKEKLARDLSIMTSRFTALRRLSQAAGADFWIDDGKAYFVSKNKYVEGEAVVLSPTTGLIGIPEDTPQGIQVRCLLNPDIKLGGLIELRTELISGVRFLPGYRGPAAPGQSTAAEDKVGRFQGTIPAPPSFTSPVGKYKVVLLDITGETRGLPWYCDMTCLALDQSGNQILSQGTPYTRISPTETGVKDPRLEKGSGGDSTEPPAKPPPT